MPLRLSVTAPSDPGQKVYRYDFDGERTPILLGRRGGVDVLLPDPAVELVHARIERRAGNYFLIHGGSSAGTRLNEAAAPKGQALLLRERDRIGIGAYAVEVSLLHTELDPPGGATTLTARKMVREVFERMGPGQAHPTLEVLDGPQAGQRLAPPAGRAAILGRGTTGELQLDDVDLWQEHAALLRDPTRVAVRDLGAAPDLAVNGRRVTGEQSLRDGDVLRLGGASLRFHDPAEPYVRQIDQALAAVPPAPSSGAGLASARGDQLLLLLGAGCAVSAGAGLVYLCLW